MSCTLGRLRQVSQGATVLALVAWFVVAMAFGTGMAWASADLPAGSDVGAGPSPQGQEGENDGRDGEAELPWLFAVFFITWAAFFAYAFVMSRRQREMQREVEALSRALADRERQAQEAESEPESPQA